MGQLLETKPATIIVSKFLTQPNSRLYGYQQYFWRICLETIQPSDIAEEPRDAMSVEILSPAANTQKHTASHVDCNTVHSYMKQSNVFLARDVIYTSSSYDTISVSVCLSVRLRWKCIVVTVHAGKRGGVISRYGSHC